VHPGSVIASNILLVVAAVDEIMKSTHPEALAANAGDGAPTASPLNELSPTQPRATSTD
jgi:hypothetical protein